MPSLAAPSLMAMAFSWSSPSHVDAMKIFCPKIAIHPIPSRRTRASPSRTTALYAGDNRWWDGGSSNNIMPNFFGEINKNGEGREVQQSSDEQQYYNQYQQNNGARQKQSTPTLITPNMEEEVIASARATVDEKTVSRAMSSLIYEKNNVISNRGDVQMRTSYTEVGKKGTNSLRDLALSTTEETFETSKDGGNNQVSDSKRSSWDTQQIAIASGATIFLLSPLVIPIIHSLLPPLIPSPSSISFTGAALLGTISYIVALGDPADQSNIITGKTGGGVLGDGVEVGGAVSRIVGRTALQSYQTSAPRLKAVARAMVDYDSTTATLEELQRVQRQLSETVLELEAENDALRKEVTLWQAVEDVSSMYKLDELKEMARYEGIKGYSADGKNALLRRLIRDGILKLDLGPYY
eukprot:CAMPEP_0181102876 /NCGR_PEP_ID=MMETSP1071-20121207/14556_1 /TAXON_ID=35127 /ORGANISM="Thalassiosira sp., Strain NH16" /LENGTH=408 /DNA_ID=CAMNT_0023185893 /DNA_START=90 /DNA_END=1316 /DNA_ORIENTATION=-